MTDTTVIQLPFSGFYESKWSSEIDHVEEREAEYFADERQSEDGIPSELRLTQDDYASIFFDVTDYSAAYHYIARQYVPGFNAWFKGETDIDLGLTYESMDSPREYNFATDRVYAHIPTATLTALFETSAANGHERLSEVIKARHTSRSGFISYYSNDLDEWLSKPLDEWDHNELLTLLYASLPDADEDYEWRIFEDMNEDFYTAHSNAVDWVKFDRLVDEKRTELRAELDPDIELPTPRCPHTLDLFARF